jgi:hypothetical protein
MDPVEMGQPQNLSLSCETAPTVVQTWEEQPGAVAPGVTKIYYIKIKNVNPKGCAPAGVMLEAPEQAMPRWSATAQPQLPDDLPWVGRISGIAPGATAQFRMTVTADWSMTDEPWNVGPFPLTFYLYLLDSEGMPIAGNSGEVTHTITFDSPTGCNRQAPVISIDNADPTPVALGTPVEYHVTVRNVDNRLCAWDQFKLTPKPTSLAEVTVDGDWYGTPGINWILPGGSMVYTVTIKGTTMKRGQTLNEYFTVTTPHRPSYLGATGSVRYRN